MVFRPGDYIYYDHIDTNWYCLGHEYEDEYATNTDAYFDSNHTESVMILGDWDIGKQDSETGSGFLVTVQTGTSYYSDSTKDRILYGASRKVGSHR